MFSVSTIGMFVYKQMTSSYFVIFNGDISDALGKGGRILDIVIFIFNISIQNVNYVFVMVI